MPVAVVNTGSFNASGVPYVLPGTVGYLGDPAALTPYSPAGSGLPGAGNAPPGWSWQPYGLRNDSSPMVLDHVHIYGGLYTAGASLTVTNSVLQAGTGTEIACIQHHGANAASGGQLIVKDSTLNWLSTVPALSVAGGADIPTIFDVNAPWYDIERCDFSGGPQGLDPPGSGNAAQPSLVLNNWVHGLIQNKPSGPNHMDGIFSEGGSYLLIQGNYVDAPRESTPGASDVTASIFFHDTTQSDPNVTVDSNYLSGGSYTFHNETAAGIVVTNNTFAGVYLFGDATNNAAGGGSIGVWSNNRHLDGSLVPSP